MDDERHHDSPLWATPQEEHEWLQRLVGEWTYESEAGMEPGEPPERFTGTESVRALGDIWILAEGKGAMPGGGEATTLLTVGYDPEKGRFVGTFVASMMTHLWIYHDGELDPDQAKLTLHAEGPSMAGDGTTATYREEIEFLSDDHRTFTSYVHGDDGEWQQVMKAHYRRAE